MPIADSHHVEAVRCRHLAQSITDGAARSILLNMALLYDDMAAQHAATGSSAVAPRRVPMSASADAAG